MARMRIACHMPDGTDVRQAEMGRATSLNDRSPTSAGSGASIDLKQYPSRTIHEVEDMPTAAAPPGIFRLAELLDHDGGTVWVWTLTTDLGHTVATSHHFPDRESALRAIHWLRENVYLCTVMDAPPRRPRMP
jgi:hypothetical protein